ncbi:hypothetical protein RND71_036834 [Anisodus tanguticus]|uniref:Alkaline/neutral invertase n=1 Tax=Anisodus tanguticus TaxID=243964 RepID=A0AAE1R1W7_9SOLA|nr:hypothetical protein RND71_036834 [Anisodus tanguticus]
MNLKDDIVNEHWTMTRLVFLDKLECLDFERVGSNPSSHLDAVKSVLGTNWPMVIGDDRDIILKTLKVSRIREGAEIVQNDDQGDPSKNTTQRGEVTHMSHPRNGSQTKVTSQQATVNVANKFKNLQERLSGQTSTYLSSNRVHRPLNIDPQMFRIANTHPPHRFWVHLAASIISPLLLLVYAATSSLNILYHVLPHPIIGEAWEALRLSIVQFHRQPVGTVAVDNYTDELKYDQVFVRDFVPSALSCLMNDQPNSQEFSYENLRPPIMVEEDRPVLLPEYTRYNSDEGDSQDKGDRIADDYEGLPCDSRLPMHGKMAGSPQQSTLDQGSHVGLRWGSRASESQGQSNAVQSRTLCRQCGRLHAG